ncbi:MAG: cupin, partial [bacterium]|nr:cupin [bacterium]
TLYTPDDNTETTEVFFAIWGANLNMDAEGNIESITDGQTVLMGYYFLLEEQGTPRPDNILIS